MTETEPQAIEQEPCDEDLPPLLKLKKRIIVPINEFIAADKSGKTDMVGQMIIS